MQRGAHVEISGYWQRVEVWSTETSSHNYSSGTENQARLKISWKSRSKLDKVGSEWELCLGYYDVVVSFRLANESYVWDIVT
jgi:hypothetical protein